jgi:hypothetical protein
MVTLCHTIYQDKGKGRVCIVLQRKQEVYTPHQRVFFYREGRHRGRNWRVLQGVASDRKRGVMTMQDKVNGVRHRINFHLFFSVHIVRHKVFLVGECVCGMVATGEAIMPSRYKKQTA